jgi:hypothetical protein
MYRLTPISPGVVHSSPYRTRLRSARWQDISEADVAVVKDALERVPGVKDVRPLMRGFVIEHEARPDVVENIGSALGEVSPILLEDLTKEPGKAKKKKHGLMDGFKDHLPQFDFTLPSFDLSTLSLSDAGPIAKKAVPVVLAGAGVMLVVEGAPLLMGVTPLALFYLAYDFHWKAKQEKILNEVVAEQHE